MTRRSVIVVAVLGSLVGCGSLVVIPEGGEGSTGAEDTTSGTTAPIPGTTATPDPIPDPTSSPTGDPPPATITTTDATTGGWGSSSGDGDPTCSFLCDPSESSGGDGCSVWEQDCPEGEKCMPWANDGGSAWNDTRCSPIDPEPDAVGESCTVEGSGVSGIDSCELGSICWDVDPQTSAGTCVPQCIGSEQAPACADEDRTCRIYAEGVLTLCFTQCNPLDPDTCPTGQGCYPSNPGLVCAPDASGDEGGLFEACEFINSCDPGLTCAGAGDVEACAGGPNCCKPFCDLDAPDCPLSTSCTPLFEPGDVPDNLLHVGLCT